MFGVNWSDWLTIPENICRFCRFGYGFLKFTLFRLSFLPFIVKNQLETLLEHFYALRTGAFFFEVVELNSFFNFLNAVVPFTLYQMVLLL